MRITERFARFFERLARIEAVESQLKELRDENAADRAAILEWFQRNKPDGGRHLGIIYSASSQRRLDVTLARRLLGARAKEAEKVIPIERLHVDPEAKAARAAATRPTPVRSARAG